MEQRRKKKKKSTSRDIGKIGIPVLFFTLVAERRPPNPVASCTQARAVSKQTRSVCLAGAALPPLHHFPLNFPTLAVYSSSVPSMLPTLLAVYIFTDHWRLPTGRVKWDASKVECLPAHRVVVYNGS